MKSCISRSHLAKYNRIPVSLNHGNVVIYKLGCVERISAEYEVSFLAALLDALTSGVEWAFAAYACSQLFSCLRLCGLVRSCFSIVKGIEGIEAWVLLRSYGAIPSACCFLNARSFSSKSFSSTLGFLLGLALPPVRSHTLALNVSQRGIATAHVGGSWVDKNCRTVAYLVCSGHPFWTSNLLSRGSRDELRASNSCRMVTEDVGTVGWNLLASRVRNVKQKRWGHHSWWPTRCRVFFYVRSCSWLTGCRSRFIIRRSKLSNI